jgi:hypothetical protein
MEAFGIFCPGFKWFHAECEDLEKLRVFIRGKIMLNDFLQFYQPVSQIGEGGSAFVR